mmetsp:Transcript_85505/g.228005  ORF Transcript_85505/g.228005 Transcript_85505/m.228005 type:complete len:305 (+) Transcript_85505:98-1012(+)
MLWRETESIPSRVSGWRGNVEWWHGLGPRIRSQHTRRMVQGPYDENFFVPTPSEPKTNADTLSVSSRGGPKSRLYNSNGNEAAFRKPNSAQSKRGAPGVESERKWYDLPNSWNKSEEANIRAAQAAQPRNLVHYDGYVNKFMAKRKHSMPTACMSPIFSGLHWQWQGMISPEDANSWYTPLETSDQPPQRMQFRKQEDTFRDELVDNSAVQPFQSPRSAPYSASRPSSGASSRTGLAVDTGAADPGAAELSRRSTANGDAPVDKLSPPPELIRTCFTTRTFFSVPSSQRISDLCCCVLLTPPAK